MSRIVEFEIAGRKYPLNFSVKAAEVVSERYGGLENITEMFSGKSSGEMMREAIFLVHLLIEQGIAYKRLVDGEEIAGISLEDLAVIMGPSDFGKMQEALMGAMMAGMGRTVEVEPDPKNAETTQAL